MKRRVFLFPALIMMLGIILAGCGSRGQSSSDAAGSSSGDSDIQSSLAAENSGTDTQNSAEEEATELIVRFGENGQEFRMHLEDNSTAAAIAGYVGTTTWQLPIYSYDESDVMQYYDIPSRYDIPSNGETVTEAHAGDVFYSDPNRIILYYHDAQIEEEYTKIGTFDATEEFIAAVEENPVLEGWGNTLVFISAEE